MADSACQHEHTERVGFTWWGGALGPRVLGMVRCTACGATFSRRSGRKPWLGIALYLTAVLALSIGLVAALLSWFAP